jgi:hypothetical protein
MFQPVFSKETFSLMENPLPQVFPARCFKFTPLGGGNLKLIHQAVCDCLARRAAFVVTSCE